MVRVAFIGQEEAATAESAAAAGADAERLTLMHDVQIKRRRPERQRSDRAMCAQPVEMLLPAIKRD